MLRLNMILLVVVVICALGVVTSQHRARKLFQALEAEQERGRQLDVEYGQLQLEMSTWANHPRIEKIASERLHMVAPDAAGRLAASRPAAKGGR
jgi:cell division protein FtsL